MAYRKFDDKPLSVDDSARKASQAFKGNEAMARALQGIANRVIGHTAGTNALTMAGCGTGSTCGVNIANTLVVSINGKQSTCIAQDNLEMPDGTMGTNWVQKYLVCTAAGTSGTVIGPGNSIDKGDYTTVALATAAAKLPDLPDGYCALGYLVLDAPAATAVGAIGTGVLGTMGTATFYDLVCMPYDL
jgi:hypothetical protein